MAGKEVGLSGWVSTLLGDLGDLSGDIRGSLVFIIKNA